jgi:hypothetical protein
VSSPNSVDAVLRVMLPGLDLLWAICEQVRLDPFSEMSSMRAECFPGNRSELGLPNVAIAQH